ncbi:MAG TPA: transcription antitermination factor NusB [Candidatus Brocadiia bacterium]|nr:transcription antitermination factor NusB [Candidatus Brocadiia bacterium]
MRARSAARAVALQALYQFDLRGEEFSSHLAGFLSDWIRDPASREYAKALIEGCRLSQGEVDEIIAAASENWDLARMSAVDRAILRIGVYEMIYGRDVPPKTAIDEAVRLAKKFSAEDSSRFINGVLDRIMKDREKRSRGA